MATTGKVIGNDLRFFIKLATASDSAYVEVGCAETVSLAAERDMATALCKEDDFIEDKRPTVKRNTIDVSGFVKYDNPFNVEEVFDFWDSGDLVEWQFRTTSTGDLVLESTGYISNFGQEAGTVEFATYSFSIASKGALVKGTVA